MKRTILLPGILFLITAFEVVNYAFGPFLMEQEGKGMMDYLFLAVILIHFLWGITFFIPRRRQLLSSLFRAPEFLFFFTFMLFLFSYIWATNANMDYVQRFAESSGNIFLAPDSTIQRINAVLKFVPYLCVTGFTIIYFRITRKSLLKKAFESSSPGFFSTWSLFITLGTAFLYTLSFPSFLNLTGFAPLAYVCLIPLACVIKEHSYGGGVFYGIVFGVIQSMLSNYWLGTFSLVSLQFSTAYYLVYYLIFMLILVWVLKKSGRLFPLVFASSWVIFDYLRSIGFLGYPWVLVGVSQYQFLPLIQISAVTGIWGVSFIVLLANGAGAQLIEGLINKQKILPNMETSPGFFSRIRKLVTTVSPFRPLVLWAVLFLAVLIGGWISLGIEKTVEPEKTVKVALIQQNTDPRKNDYTEGYAILQKLTNQALLEDPDLIAWSETAFVPNIQRWSKPEYEYSYLGKIVRNLLDYLKSIETWLVTGNDDYTLETGEDGEEIRKDYNAAILFSDTGERMQTYHKIHLVPFTESFPYKKLFPGFYQLLLDFDVYLWEAGDEWVVFQHPEFTFATPICFEDGFPNHIRTFVRKGAEVIMNLSNDFWSLTEVEAKQHYINSVFRAVENRTPLLRSTASGLTCYVDRTGKLRGSLPYYEEAYMIAEVEMPPGKTSLYTRWGDWFPFVMMGIVLAVTVLRLQASRRSSSRLPKSRL